MVFLWLCAPDCACAMEPYTPELVNLDDNIELVNVEEVGGVSSEEARREEMLIVVDTEIAHTVVVGTVIFFVFVVAYLIPTTN